VHAGLAQSCKKKGAKNAAGDAADQFKKIKVFTLTRALNPEQGFWMDVKAPDISQLMFGQVAALFHACSHFLANSCSSHLHFALRANILLVCYALAATDRPFALPQAVVG